MTGGHPLGGHPHQPRAAPAGRAPRHRRHSMPNPATARYCDAAGGWHDVVVRQTAEDAWEIVDVAAKRTRIVDTLRGYDDGRPQAAAVARDYAAQRHREPVESLRPDAQRIAA